MKANVSIMRCNSYSMDILIPVIENVISTSDFPEVNGRTVFVKPNILSDSKPESCITTNPEFLRAFIRILKKRGAASVLVGDSPGLPAPSFAAMGCGIGQVCKEEGAKWIDIGSDNIIVAIPFTKQRLPVAAAVSTSDLVISLPKFKTHQLMYFTGGVKNLFGVIPGLHKSPCHLAFPTREAFAKFICGLYSYVKPDYCLMDGIIGMEGPGPANGTPRAVGLVLGSSDCGALDYSEATIMGYKPNSTPLIRALKAKGLFPEGISYPLLSAGELVISDFKRISITEKTKFVRTLIIPFFTRGIQKRRQMKEPAPEFLTDVCIRCRRCIEICPGNALEMKNGKVERSLSRCIRCYCCHEVCPADAIVIPKITKR
ncbi:MAG: DUF362 domain-containing protein [Sphaerochaetaceae bacterium]|jgi:uncharacterized protein (DUF362 family)/Pyruvate/2-oxoacid:ferredoxin oxidoreductase delta subunit|nr:DUF362 domain-containing protein [Sphaerochaetaceae bacterium]